MDDNGIPYSREIWQGLKFGGLAICLGNHQNKMK
jgi:hypothetical protein